MFTPPYNQQLLQPLCNPLKVQLQVALLKVRRSEPLREHVLKRINPIIFPVNCQYYFKGLWIAKLHHNLAAYSAWRCITCRFLILSAHDTYCLKIPHAFTHSLKKCCPFRTVCRCVGCIFYIAAGVDCLIFFAKRAAPTLKPEYGAYEKSSCARAVSIKFFNCFFIHI